MSPDAVFDALDAIIDAGIANHPRSLQVQIGPSEVGHACDRCLGHILAGTPQLPDPEPPWLPTVGTAVHAWLDDTVTMHALEQARPGRDIDWMTECKVDVGEIDGRTITGNSDLFHVPSGTVVDYKIVGPTTLRSAKAGPSEQYRRQAHLYGRGWRRAGYRVNHVAILYLPRNSVLRKTATVRWCEPYDEHVAVRALQRADALAKAIRLAGPDAVLPTLRRADGCYDCPRFPAYPTDPPLPSRGVEPFADLLGTHQ